MADDYRRIIDARRRPPGAGAGDLPAHFTEDYSSLARAIASQFGLDLADVLGPRREVVSTAEVTGT